MSKFPYKQEGLKQSSVQFKSYLTPQIWRLKGYVKSIHTQNTGKHILQSTEPWTAQDILSKMIQHSPKTGYFRKKRSINLLLLYILKLKRNNTFRKPNCNLKPTIKSKLKLNFIRFIFICFIHQANEIHSKFRRGIVDLQMKLKLLFPWRAMKARRNHQNVLHIIPVNMEKLNDL